MTDAQAENLRSISEKSSIQQNSSNTFFRWKDISSSWAALFGSILTFIGGVLGVLIANVWGEQARNQSNIALERQKFEISLIQDAIRNIEDDEDRMKTLMFVACAGFIPTYRSDVISLGKVYDLSCDRQGILVPEFTTADERIKNRLFPPGSTELEPDEVEAMRACWPQAGVPPDTLIIDFMLQLDFAEEREIVAQCMERRSLRRNDPEVEGR